MLYAKAGFLKYNNSPSITRSKTSLYTVTSPALVSPGPNSSGDIYTAVDVGSFGEYCHYTRCGYRIVGMKPDPARSGSSVVELYILNVVYCTLYCFQPANVLIYHCTNIQSTIYHCDPNVLGLSGL